MTARKLLLLPALLLLAATAAPAAQEDPHDLLDKARTRLKQGDLAGASAATTSLHQLLAKDPRWDPDGTFARHLLPSLEGRIERATKITRDLDAFNARGLKGLKSPKTAADFPTVQQYTDWATSLIQQLRHERDQIVEAGIKDPEDRACIARTASYAASERLLQTDLLKQASEAAGDEVLGLLSGDPRMEAVLVRFRQLKLDLVQAVRERDALRTQLQDSKEREAALRQSLDSGTRPTRLPLSAERLLTILLALAAAAAVWVAIKRGKTLAAQHSAACLRESKTEGNSRDIYHDAA